MAAFNFVTSSDTVFIAGTDLIPVLANELLAYDKASVPLQTMMMSMGHVRPTTNPTFFDYEGQFDDPGTTCSALSSGAADATQSVVFATLNVRVGDRYKDPVKNQLLVVVGGAGTGNTIQYNTPGAGQSTALIKRFPTTSGIIANSGTGGNVMLIRVDNQMLDADFYTAALSNKPTKISNGISYLNDKLSVSKLMNDTASYWNKGNEQEFQRLAMVERVRKNIDRTMWFSEFYQTEIASWSHDGNNTKGGMAYSTDGILNTIDPSYNIDCGATLTETAMDQFFQQTFWGKMYYGSNYRIGFSGSTFLEGVMSLAKNRTITPTGVAQMTYGLSVQTYIAFGGQQAYLMLEREFQDHTSGVANALSKACVFIDPQYLQMLYHGPSLIMLSNIPTQTSEYIIAAESRPAARLKFKLAHGMLHTTF